jgi:hypothetical protein
MRKGTDNKRNEVTALPNRLAELEAKAPPVPAVVAKARSFLAGLVGADAEADGRQIGEMIREKAKGGDVKAASLYTATMMSIAGLQRASQEDEEEARRERNRQEIRERIGLVLLYQGPQHEVPLVQQAGALLPDVLKVLRGSDWFEHEADGWHITSRGRAAVQGK